MHVSRSDPLLRRRLGKVALLVFACSLLVLGLLPASAKALPPVGWTYCYDRYSGGLWVNSQSTYNSARWWPAPGYTSSSSYYRLGSDLDFAFATAVGQAATTWSNPDTMFHFYSLPLGGSDTDHVLKMSSARQMGTIAVLYGHSVWNISQRRAEVGNWYIRFNSNYTWCNGAYAGQADRRSKATHEMGHAIRLKDLDGDPNWTFYTKPTMYGFWGTGTIGERDLAAGDLTGIRQLY